MRPDSRASSPAARWGPESAAVGLFVFLRIRSCFGLLVAACRLSGNRVVAPVAKGLAARNTFQGQPAAA